MIHRRIRAAILATGVALAGCMGTAGEPGEGAGPDRSSASGSGIIVQGETLRKSGNILRALIGRVPNMQVKRTRRCPSISLRGMQNFTETVAPGVYVDGTRAVNTCVLTMLRADDTERVEIYPLGMTSRPGYATHPYGLILIFTRTAEP